MKLNKISLVLAAMALVGCSSEDVSDFSANQAIDESGLVQLSPNFVLAGVGQDDAFTRTHWEWNNPITHDYLINKFLPIYKAGAAAGDMLDAAAELDAQAVGLCWLGNGAVGTDVYTNYQFYHFGWLNKGAAKAEFECDELTNGSMYDEIGTLLAVTNGAGGEALPGTDWTVAELPAKSVHPTTGLDNLNYNSGVYQTKNKAIFGGDYIVYYPYNEDFKNAGTIPAKAVTKFNPVAQALTDKSLGQATFRYSAPVTIEGGDQAADFGLYNLSTLVQVRVAGPAAATPDLIVGQNIDKIVLYSAKKQLLQQANLAADKIAAWQTGTDLYASTEGTKTISATFAAPVAVAATDGAVTSAYITVLPTTVEDLVVLVHNSTNSTWARVNLPNTVFEAGTAKRLDIPVKNADFTTDYIAVDEPTLIAARNEARLTATPANKKTITVIGDITLDGTTADAANTYNFNALADANITISGDNIIVPENITLNSATNFVSDVRVLGKSCCSNPAWLGGRLNIAGGTLNNVTMEPTEAKITGVAPATYDNYNPMVTYAGAATIAADKTFDAQAGTIVVNAAVQHKGDITIAEGVKLTVNGPAGDLNFMGSSVVNNGTIEVMKNGNFDMTDANGNATATDGQRMTNNGKFIHNVDAGVGTAVQSMNQNGEYRCLVDKQVKLDDAFLQWTACSVIEMVNPGAYTYNLGTADGISYKHNGKYIDYEVNAGGLTTFNNPVVSGTNGDSKVIQVGNLSVLAGGLNVDFVTGNGKRTLTVNGDMYVNANTTFTDSKLIDIKENLTVDGAGVTLFYKGNKKNEGGLKVAKTILVWRATFDAGSAAADVDAINITCADFTVTRGGTAIFGNRTDGGAKNMVVSGTISNVDGTFNILPANQDGNGSVLAWVSCSQLIVGGNFPNSKPRVE